MTMTMPCFALDRIWSPLYQIILSLQGSDVTVPLAKPSLRKLCCNGCKDLLRTISTPVLSIRPQ